MTTHGIGETVLNSIIRTCLSFPTVKQVILYGSRARGDFRLGSDIDIAIDAPEMSDKEFVKIWNELDDLPIVYSMDVLHLQKIANAALIEAINKEGVVL